MNDTLIIVGASGHGKVVADIALNLNKWKRIAFLDDNVSIKTSLGFDVIGKTTDMHIYKNQADFFVAIGNNEVRKKILRMLEDEGISVINLIHPKTIIGSNVEIGIGTVVMAGVVINNSSRIGKGCIINTTCSIDHDNIIDDYVHLSPGVKLAGTVYVGTGNWIGIGSVISNNVNICNNCVLGAGSVVVDDITVPGTYVGMPVRRVIR